MIYTETNEINASCLHEHLWQGGLPPIGPCVKNAGFDFLVLCAHEYQPPARKFPGVRVWHAPAVDDFDSPPTKPMLEVAIAAANKVVEAIGRGETVLVTCMAGVNRSSLVSGLALHKLLGLSGKDVCAMIQLQRPGTLTNPHFTQCLSNLPQRF